MVFSHHGLMLVESIQFYFVWKKKMRIEEEKKKK